MHFKRYKRIPRSWLTVWHRWFGLMAAIWLTLMAITGSILVFYDELDSLLNSDIRRIPAHDMREQLPVNEIINTVIVAYPEMYISRFFFPKKNNESIRLQLSYRAPINDSSGGFSIYLNPYTAQILGERKAGVIQLNRRHIMNVIYELHLDLLLGRWLSWFLGLVAFMWLIDHIISLLISFPNIKKWKMSFAIRYSAGGYKRLFDSHRSIGLWFFPVTVSLALSSMYFNWYDSFTWVVNKVSPITPRYIFTVPSVKNNTIDPAIDFYDAVNIVQQAIKNHAFSENKAIAHINMATYIPSKSLYEFRLFDDRDIDSYGRRLMVISADTGDILSDRHVVEGGAGDLFIAWQYPLHSGKAFGWPGRILIFFTGLSIVFLSYSGIKIWLRKRQAYMYKNNNV